MPDTPRLGITGVAPPHTNFHMYDTLGTVILCVLLGKPKTTSVWWSTVDSAQPGPHKPSTKAQLIFGLRPSPGSPPRTEPSASIAATHEAAQQADGQESCLHPHGSKISREVRPLEASSPFQGTWSQLAVSTCCPHHVSSEHRVW